MEEHAADSKTFCGGRTFAAIRRAALSLASASILWARLEGNCVPPCEGQLDPNLPVSRDVLVPFYIEAIFSLLGLLWVLYNEGYAPHLQHAVRYMSLTSTLLLITLKVESAHALPYTVAALPSILVSMGLLGLAVHEAYGWYQDLPRRYLADCACLATPYEWALGLPVHQKGFQRVTDWILEFGVMFSGFLLSIKLDSNAVHPDHMEWGGVITPLAFSEFCLFCFCTSQCCISECVDPNFRTIFTGGYITRVMWLLPPIAISEFLLVAQLDHLEHAESHDVLMPWTAVFVPLVTGLSFWLLGETICQPCCREEVSDTAGQSFDHIDEENPASQAEAETSPVVAKPTESMELESQSVTDRADTMIDTKM